MTKSLSATVVALAGALCATAAALPAYAQPEDREWAPVVKRLSGDDLPAALKLSTFVSKMDKSVRFDPELAKKSLQGRGLEVDDADLELLTSLYGDFDEDQAARHGEVLREFPGQTHEIREAGDAFVMERAAFEGGVLGAWLAHLRDQGEDTDAFLVQEVERSSVSMFWGGRPPTMEQLDRQAAAFEQSFRREYGVPLRSVLRGGRPGGGR